MNFGKLNTAFFLVAAVFVFSSCEKEDNTVIDPSISAPIITGQFQSKDTVLTTSSAPVINLNASVIVNTNDGSPISNVKCFVTDPSGNSSSFAMLDNGVAPDTNSNDGKYSAAINLGNIQCLLVGKYLMEFVAENNSGLFSNLLTSSFVVVNTANQPPVITGTNLPDSVVRPHAGDSTLLTISINVADPDGICDLKDVTFVTTRPNGIVLPPIPMFYNGNGEFLFANFVSYSSDPSSYGYFKYEFTARDNSNIFSAPVKDSIKFVQPTNP